MNHPSLYPKRKQSFTQRHISIILFLLCVLIISMVFIVAFAIHDPNIYTAYGGL